MDSWRICNFVLKASKRGLLVLPFNLKRHFCFCVFVSFVLLFLFVYLQRTEHALECRVTRMPHVKTWFKDQLASVMMDTKGLGQNALVSGSIICQIVKQHLTAHIASVKDQLLKELCYTICYLFKQLELKAHQLNSKNNGPCLLFKTIFKNWSCFLSSVAKDDRDGDGLKLSVDFSPNSTKGDSSKNWYKLLVLNNYWMSSMWYLE